MKLSQSINMKEILANSLYLLMKDKTFDKITIKQIADKAGVIRGTFYNHFYDKYEALDYLVRMILFKEEITPNTRTEYMDLLSSIFKTIKDEEDFFSECFKITGQNGFDSILNNIFKDILRDYFRKSNLDSKLIGLKEEFVLDYLSKDILFQLNYWNDNNYVFSADEMSELFKKLHVHSTRELIGQMRN